MTPMDRIAPEAWVTTLEACRADGFAMLDVLTGVDRGEQIEIVVRVVDPTTARARMVSTLATDRLPSATSVYPGASWHERETAEMFGIAFDGLADDRPLLLREPVDAPPLRKSVLLDARLDREWPGSGGNRRTRPLGVPADGGDGR